MTLLKELIELYLKIQHGDFSVKPPEELLHNALLDHKDGKEIDPEFTAAMQKDGIPFLIKRRYLAEGAVIEDFWLLVEKHDTWADMNETEGFFDTTIANAEKLQLFLNALVNGKKSG